MTKELYEYIGQKIKIYRENNELSQEKLANRVGVTANTISRWETATYKPSVKDLDNLSREFKVPIWVFLPQAIEPPTAVLQGLLSATGDLPKEDIEELQRYADFIRAKNVIKKKKVKE